MPESTTATRATKGAGQTIDAPTTGALVPTPPPPDIADVAAWMAFDRADEEQIVTEIVTGDLIDALVYEFGEGKNAKRGVSYAGINWCVRQMAIRGIGRIGIKSPLSEAMQLHEGHDANGEPVYKCVIIAVDNQLGTEAIGMADALRYPPAKNGGTYTDLMAERKAVSKAQRNAKSALVPEELKAELIAAVKGTQIKRVRSERQQVENEAEAKGKSRARKTQAEKPRREGPVANAGQQRLMAAKFKEGGGPELAKELKVDEQVLYRALLGWAGDYVHADRIPKAKVDAVVEALADPGAAVDGITSFAKEAGTTVDHQRARWVLTELPAFAKALGIEPAQGEQQTLDGGQ